MACFMTVVVPMITFTDAYALIDRFVVDAEFATYASR